MADLPDMTPKPRAKNRRRRVQRIWILVAFLSLFAMFSPFIFEGQAEFLEIDRFGGALMLLGMLLAITGFVASGFYRGLARLEDRLQRTRPAEGPQGADTIPSPPADRFLFTPEEWRFSVNAAYVKDIRHTLSTWLVIVFFSFVICSGFAIATGNAVLFSILGGVLTLLFGNLAFLAPIVRRRRLLRSEPEVVLSREGLLVGSALHSFAQGWTTLESVDFKDGWLTVVYSAPTRTGRQDYAADVWFPERLQPQVHSALHALFEAPPQEVPSS
jgi:hypothetical protein